MDDVVRQNILGLLREAIEAIENGDSFRLRGISNGNLHTDSIFQDEDSLSISVLIYALSKVIEGLNKKSAVLLALRGAAQSLRAGKDERYREQMRVILKIIKVEDSRLRKFLSTVVEQAQIKKGCALCEHGISIGRAAAILGISRWELMNYLGKTTIMEQSSERIPTEQRLALARRIFE